MDRKTERQELTFCQRQQRTFRRNAKTQRQCQFVEEKVTLESELVRNFVITDRKIDRETERQKDRKTERQKDRKTERQKDRDRDRETK
jgi:hypothetical protein